MKIESGDSMYKALIVDDEIMIRNGIEKVISWSSMGIQEVMQAASGEEALSIIDRVKPDIMITDINMTGMTGLELIEKSRSIHPKMKVFVLTGYDDFHYVQQSLRLHVVDFFLKPIDEEVLEMAIKDAIEEIRRDTHVQVKQNCEVRALGIREQTEIERLMRRLIHRDAIEESVNHLKTKYLYDVECHVMVAIVEPNLDLNDPEIQYKNLFIKNISIDLFDAQEEGITFTDVDGRIVIALFFDAEGKDCKEKLESLSNILADEYNSEAKIIAGSMVGGFENISISYNDALILYNNEKEEVESIIQSQKTEKKQKLFEEIFTELKHYMIVNTGNIDLIYKAFDTFVKTVDVYNLSVLQVRRCCFDIASELYFAYISDTGNEVDDKLIKLMEALNLAPKVVACNATRDFINQLFDAGNHQQQDDLIGCAKLYINEHLNADLSVAKLAEHLFVSPNYLSRLFKKVAGIGCSEYIIKQRISKAKAMLETTSVQTGNIARYVGYKDINYFSVAFKKYTGLSPTVYREKIRDQQRDV